jgi:2'-5' RNA ligase
VRQFLAVDLSDELRAELGALQKRLQGETRGWRWVQPGNIHLTLRFLGEVPAEHERGRRDLWSTAAAHVSPFSFRLQGIGSFPPRGRPRVLWVGVREQGGERRLEQLAADLEAAARGAGFEHENRPFRPHLTLARAERSGRATLPELLQYGPGAALDVDHATLFQSQLLPAGARYSVLESFALGAS